MDQRTGLIDRAWYMFFISLFQTAQDAGGVLLAPNTASIAASLEQTLERINQELQTQPVSVVDQVMPLIDALAQRLDTLPPIQLGTIAALNTDNVPFLGFSTNPSPPIPDPPPVGTLYWNGGYTLNLRMTSNVTQAIGENQYYYIKASATISKGQLIMFDGAVGSSGVLKGKPSTGVTNGQLIMGVAAEDIALNDFGLVSNFGLVRGFNTSGAPYGETWADGDTLYYNPSFAGGLTKTQPLAPTPHVVVAAVVNAATGGSGSVFVRVLPEPLVSQLSDVYVTSLAGDDILVYDSTDQRWENKAPTAARDALGLGTGNPSNGQMLIGNGTDFTTAALTAGSGIAITTGAGSATIATTGATGSFLSADTPNKTVTVSNGIITSIV
jgi:hypothetical protein